MTSPPPTSPSPSPARIMTVIVVLLLGIALVLGAGLALLSGVPRAFTDTFVGQADLSTPRVPFVESWDELDPKGFEPMYSGVTIQSQDPLPVPRTLRAVERGLTDLIGVLAGLTLVVISIGLLQGRGFSRSARHLVGALGILVMITAIAAPQLDALAVDVAAQQLGYPIFDPSSDMVMTESSPEKIVLALWDPLWALNRVDFVLVALGSVIALSGFLLRDGLLLQRRSSAEAQSAS